MLNSEVAEKPTKSLSKTKLTTTENSKQINNNKSNIKIINNNNKVIKTKTNSTTTKRHLDNTDLGDIPTPCCMKAPSTNQKEFLRVKSVLSLVL